MVLITGDTLSSARLHNLTLIESSRHLKADRSSQFDKETFLHRFAFSLLFDVLFPALFRAFKGTLLIVSGL